MRTSSAANVGADKDSDKRQRKAIEAYAKANGYIIDEADWFYDAAVKGADPVTERPGFAKMLERLPATACGMSWWRARTALRVIWSCS
jgi:DNA invertase Pin-like site-specific DNA recombinase